MPRDWKTYRRIRVLSHPTVDPQDRTPQWGANDRSGPQYDQTRPYILRDPCLAGNLSHLEGTDSILYEG
jgi:hypothetical protein